MIVEVEFIINIIFVYNVSDRLIPIQKLACNISSLMQFTLNGLCLSKSLRRHIGHLQFIQQRRWHDKPILVSSMEGLWVFCSLQLISSFMFLRWCGCSFIFKEEDRRLLQFVHVLLLFPSHGHMTPPISENPFHKLNKKFSSLFLNFLNINWWNVQVDKKHINSPLSACVHACVCA